MSIVSVFSRSSSLPFSLRWSAGVGSRLCGSYVCLSLTSESILSVYSFLSITTVTRPFSAGSTTMSLSFFSRFNPCNSSFVKLQSVSEADCRVEAILLLMSSLVDSGTLSWARTDSTLDAISSVGMCLGVTECLSPWESTCVSFSSKGREEIFLTQFLLVLWRFLFAAC